MPVPRMVIAAGPSGGGKSTVLNVFKLDGVDAFNVDDQAGRLYAQIQGSSNPIYHSVPSNVRNQAREQMRAFIQDHIDGRRSFALETTLRDVTFEQAREATAKGFRVEMTFIAAGDVNEHISRVEARAERGGHTASRASLTEIYGRAMRHLIDAFEENRRGNIDHLMVVHNPTALVPKPEPVVVLSRGTPTYVAQDAPEWFHANTRGTAFELTKLQERARDAFER